VGTPYSELTAPSRLTLARVWTPYLTFHLGEAIQITLVKGKRVSRDRGSSALCIALCGSCENDILTIAMPSGWLHVARSRLWDQRGSAGPHKTRWRRWRSQGRLRVGVGGVVCIGAVDMRPACAGGHCRSCMGVAKAAGHKGSSGQRSAQHNKRGAAVGHMSCACLMPHRHQQPAELLLLQGGCHHSCMHAQPFVV
jgi:hypothetical protein